MKKRARHFPLYLRDRASDFQKLRLKVMKHPTVGSVHKLRVCVSRIRAALWIYSRHGGGISVKKLDRRLRDLHRSLGKVREFDVAIRDAGRFKLTDGRLRNERKAARGKLRGLITKTSQNRIMEDLRAVAAEARNLSIGSIQATDLLHGSFPEDSFAELVRPKEIHDLRVRVKKLRYRLEAIDSRAEPLRRLQRTLGRAHDLHVMQQWLGRDKAARDEEKALERRALEMAGPALHALRMKITTGAE